MDKTLIRRCPACQTENPPSTLRCACGLLLTGIDLSVRSVDTALSAASETAAPTPTTTPETTPIAASNRRCPHTDCQQENPPDASDCLYCNRPLATAPAVQASPATLISLPTALRERFRIVRALPAAGMEAELLVVEPLQGGAPRIAKIYRHGIRPKPEVLQRVARIDAQHCVQIDEFGDSDGFAYEVMEFCPLGSLRELLRPGAIDSAGLTPLIGELATALAALHAAGLIHRDLKPENILIRQREPLDLVLTDFGIASLGEATLRFTSVARSVAYAAPESLSGVVDAKTDYWALGMIVLEAALGAHPFAGLSEPVILHRLTTRSIDLSAIAAPRLKLLLGGLLVRDPKMRWGESEIARWLRGDQNLQAPRDSHSASAPHAPYRIAEVLCETPEQLAAALATHWKEGIFDLENGQLLQWFRKELKNQNLERFLVDVNLDRQQHVDRRLLRLIIHLAPGMPPMWRGEGIDIGNILRHADAALRGDESAADWLDSIYQHRVLEAWSAAGNEQAGDLSLRWQQSAERFEASWLEAKELLLSRRREKRAIADYDELLYGHLSGPSRPPLRLLHARLLALAYDENWGKRLRQRISGELLTLATHCPWLAELGDPQSVATQRVLVIEILLPEARKAAKLAEERQAETKNREESELTALAAQAVAAIENLRSLAGKRWLDEAGLNTLRDGIGDFFGISARLRALGEGSESSEAGERQRKLRKLVARAEPVVSRLLEKVDTLAVRRAENTGWLNQNTAAFAALVLLIGPGLFSQRLLAPLAIILVALLAWRLLPNHFLKREIRRLGQALRSDGFR